MSKLQIHRIAEASVPTGTAHTGKVYFTSDRNLYVIDSAGNKIKFSDVVFSTNEASITGLSTKYQNKIYVALAEGTMWFWTGTALAQLGANNLYVPRTQEVRDFVASTVTLELRDANSLMLFISSSSQELLIPENSSVAFPIGFKVEVTQLGAGILYIVGLGSVTLLGATALAFQYGKAEIIKTDTDTWLITGDVA